MVVLKHPAGMRIWHPPYVSQEDPYSGGMREVDPSADPYGWVGDPPEALQETEQHSLQEAEAYTVSPEALAALVEEVRPRTVIGRCFRCKATREILNPVVPFNRKNAAQTR